MDVRIVRPAGLACLVALVGCSGSPTTPGGHSGPGATTLASVGQSITFLDSANFNTSLSLASGGQYLIAVVNTANTASVSESFTLNGTFAAASGSRVANAPLRAMVRPSTARPIGSHSLDADQAVKRIQSLRRMQKNHMRMLDRDNQIFQNFASVRAARSVNRPRFSISQNVGDVNKIYVAKEFGATCSDVDSIGARTVAVGQHVIVLADTNTSTTTNGASPWPTGLRPDSSFYQTFANEYDAITWNHIQTYIGNPLAFDTALSNTGKVTVVITPVLNNFGGGIVAFVDGCDFNTFTPSGSEMSLDNQTEMFYYWTPDTALGWSTPFWEELMRATAAHETKHIVSFTDRIILNNFQVPELIWLEEGLAQESSEIWERNFNQATWKGHANFDQTVACELSFDGSSPCDPSGTKPIALLGSHLPFLFDYLQEETPNPVGHGLGTDTPSNYGAGWEFARWATDQYGSSEATFIKSLINEGSLNGLPNMSAKTGKSIPELLVYWSLATGIIDTVTYTASDVRTTIPSFDFGNIFFVGQTELRCQEGNTEVPCGLFTNSGLPVYPVQPDTVTAGPISAVVTVPGTSAAYFLLSAPNGGTETLQLQNGSGGALSSSSALRVGIIRVQ
jgi:hypothetical protein